MKILFALPMEILGLQMVYSGLFGFFHNGGTWFISCIVICYILFPYFAAYIRQMRVKSRMVLLFSAVFILLYSPVLVRVLEIYRIYSNPFFRACEFMIGVILASVQDDIRNIPFIKNIFLNWQAVIAEFAVMVIAVTLACRYGFAEGDYMMYSWICLQVFMLQLVAFHSIKIKSCVLVKIFKYASSLCYGIFLGTFFSGPIIERFIQAGYLDDNLERIFSLVVLTFIFAVALHEMIEKPCKKFLKRKFIKF